MSSQVHEVQRSPVRAHARHSDSPSPAPAVALRESDPVVPPGYDDLPAGRVEDIPHIMDRASVLTRVVEILVACAGLLITLPVMLVISIVIKRESRGPAFFKQERLGLNGKPFTLFKFRTLYADARERFPEMYEYSYSAREIKELVFKTGDDPRITSTGRWLRKTSLDELPNIWNVLRGDMALVGPRPQIPEMLPYYKGDLLKRFSVRPGLTDLAHCSGRSNLSFLHTSILDQEYAERRSLRMDIAILWKTFLAVLRRDGAF